MKKIIFFIILFLGFSKCYAAQFCLNIEDDQVDRATAGVTNGGTTCEDGENLNFCAIRKVSEQINSDTKDYEARKAYKEASDNFNKINIS